jgi:DNA-binding LacI/PurR family transcriptional regulator
MPGADGSRGRSCPRRDVRHDGTGDRPLLRAGTAVPGRVIGGRYCRVMTESRRGKQPGIADVARLAGVSNATVSRVLNGSDQVSARRRAAVTRAVDELGYRPNEAARALVSGRNRLVGVLAGDTARYGFASTIQGIQEAAIAHGLLVTVAVVRTGHPDDARSAVDLLLRLPLAGVVGIEFDSPVSRALELLPTDLPAASATLMGTHLSGVPHAHIDDEVGARLATEHLLGLGHRTVHHLSVDHPSESGRGRTRAYLETLARAGVAAPEVIMTGWHPRQAYDATLRALADDATALFCFNDDIALGSLRALTESGRRVPDDISLVGFDDATFSQVISPSLTSVRMDFRGLGRAVLEQLVARMEDTPAPDDVDLPAQLIVRESTAAPR